VKTARHFVPDDYDRQSHVHALHYARLYLFMSALHPTHPQSGQDLPNEARKLTQMAQESAIVCLDVCLRSMAFRSSLAYATPSQYLEICFSALLLVKTAGSLSPQMRTFVLRDVEELVSLLGDSHAARRYSVTIKCVSCLLLLTSALLAHNLETDHKGRTQ
jgi:hypothetical protein